MERDEQSPRRESHEQWLDEEEELLEQPPMRRGVVNERRSDVGGRGTQFMTLMLLGVLVVTVLLVPLVLPP